MSTSELSIVEPESTNLSLHDTLTPDTRKQLHKEMIAVAIPALVASIVEPLLTLIDTSCIGKFMDVSAGTAALAAISVNGAIFNVISAAAYPLCTAATSLVAEARGRVERDATSKNNKKNEMLSQSQSQSHSDMTSVEGGAGEGITTTTTSSTNTDVSKDMRAILANGLFLASTMGTLLTGLILLFSKPLMTKGFPDLEPHVLLGATNYLRIRALSLPSVIVNNVVVGYSLGVQNIKAPILSLSLAFIFNTLGDFLFIGPLKMGLEGAAIATMLSSYIGSLVALIYLKTTYKISFRKSSIEPPMLRKFFSASTAIFAGVMLNTLTYSMGAKLTSFAGGQAGIDAMKATAQATTLAAKELALASMASVAKICTIEVAAQQIAMQLWWFLSFFGSPLCLVAQALLPRDLGAGRYNKAKYLTKLLMFMSVVVGVVTTAISVLVPIVFPATFTSNIQIQDAVLRIIPQSSLSLFVIVIATMLDGAYIGAGMLKEYAFTGFVSTAAAWLYYLHSIRSRLGLVGTWNGLLIFCLARMTMFTIMFPALWARISGKGKGKGKDLVQMTEN